MSGNWKFEEYKTTGEFKNAALRDFKYCYINPDRTPAQRAKDKELRETLKLKRKEGLDMVIKGGRLVLRDDSKSQNFH